MKTMKTKGYKKGGLKMVKKDGKMVPFYAADGIGKMSDGGEVEMPPGVGNMPLTDKQAEEAIRILEERARNKKKKDKPFKGAIPAKKKKPSTDRKLKPGEVRAKGGGMMKTKGYKKGGAMKTKGYSKGGKVGKVRGAGIAKRGVRKCKMR